MGKPGVTWEGQGEGSRFCRTSMGSAPPGGGGGGKDEVTGAVGPVASVAQCELSPQEGSQRLPPSLLASDGVSSRRGLGRAGV